MGKRERFGLVDVLLGAGAGVCALVFYLITLAPTVLYYAEENFDSAHLQVIGYVLGIPSYTGYPTYAMLAHLFTYLPIGDPAYRVNLASAVFGALAVVLVYVLARRLMTGRIAAIAAALAFGLSQTFWSQAVIAEVYTLHILLTTLVFLALLVWRGSRQDRHLMLAASLGGLAMTNHLTSIFLVPAAFLFVLVVDRRKLWNPALAAKGAGLFALGLVPYLYLPVRASMDPPLVGAEPTGDPSNLAGFVDLVSGGEHKGRMFAFGPAELPGRFQTYFFYLLENLSFVVLGLALLGTVYMLFRDRAALVLLVSVFVFNLGYALQYDIEDLEIYFIPTYLMLCLLFAVGAGAILRWVGGRSVVRRTLLVAGVVLIFGAALVGVPAAYRAADRGDDFRGRRIVEAVAGEVEPGATVLYHGRSLHYMQIVEDRRTDIHLEDPFYTLDWVERAERNLRNGPVYVLYPGRTNARLYKEAGYELDPVRAGMLYEVVEP